MQDSLFKRYITAFGMMLLTCTLLLGLALLYFSAYNYSKQKRNILFNAASMAIGCINDNIDLNAEGSLTDLFSDEYSIKTVQTEFANIYKTTGATVYIRDLDESVVLCADGIYCIHGDAPIPDSVLDNLLSRYQSDYHVDYWEGLFRGTGYYSYSCVLLSSRDEIRGYLFCVTPVSPLYDYLSEMALTFLISTTVMIILATVIIYFTTRLLVQPLHEITSAADKFGGGDFSARVTVTGEDEMAKLAASFNHMADSLAEYENTRRGFVANVSHELRTPMTTIGGYIDGILDKTIPADKENHYLSIVSEEVKRLSRLTSSLLDLVRVEEGAVSTDMVTINVWEVILSVMGNCEERISRQRIIVPDIDDEPRYALCDKDMLYQVIYNLVDNAIKYTPENGILSIRSSLSAGYVTIYVRNTGRGIKEEALGYVFERFYKVDTSRGLDRSGTGLGLYIAKTLTQKMGGELAVSSIYGQYAEFSVRLRAGLSHDRLIGRGKRDKSTSQITPIDRKVGG